MQIFHQVNINKVHVLFGLSKELARIHEWNYENGDCLFLKVIKSEKNCRIYFRQTERKTC